MTTGRRWVRPARAVVLLAVDLAAASGAGLLILRQFRIWNELHRYPPICANYDGDEMACDASDGWVPVVALSVFCAVLICSIWIERRRGWL